ncbi:unnamed protein product [Mytilus edulis]|uniref:Uncharacterized protein n=1 Tax=Mytilus edulis TaxID=6550 RepID=A0A8S3QVA7_MYTED|nr:unnamed protein product [Mytilus edulis]
MQINQEKFRLLLPRIQTYVTQKYKMENGNTNGQKQLFINTFSMYQWMKLSEKDKAKHTLTDCEQCMVFDASLLHKSSEVVKKDSLVGACQNVANIILEKSPPMSKAAEKNVENFVKVFSPIASHKLGVDIIKTVSKDPCFWKKLGEKFNVTNKKGERPANAGQILMGFAQYNKINTDQFNINMRISHRDYIQRVRRAKKTIIKGLDHTIDQSKLLDRTYKTKLIMERLI